MSVNTAKIAVSLPKKTLAEVEHIRHELGLARSAAISEALNLWLHRKEEEGLEERYAKGYTRHPEDASAAKSLFHAGLTSFTKDKW
jgi:metal-responsive CopG/Arc/MetJ family transcriptional regulator